MFLSRRRERQSLKNLAKDKSSLLIGVLWLAAASTFAQGADLSLPITGNLVGSVLDLQGIPQMGASVQLFDRFDQLIGHTFTSGEGRFAFASLPANSYSVRVSLPAFLPAVRDGISVKAGLDSRLQIHLATLLSSVDLSYSLPSAAMSDDWRWALRASPATRPVTRLVADTTAGKQSSDPLKPHIFSGTRAMFSLSGGDSSIVDTDGAQGDLGTAFVLSTSILGKNQVEVGGTFGQSALVGPATLALCAIYTRDDDAGLLSHAPEVSVTISQVAVAGAGQGIGVLTNLSGAAPPVRTLAISTYQTADPLDAVHLEYGMTSESVDYLQHSSRISPFARMTVDLGSYGKAVASYSDGDRPDQLAAHSEGRLADDSDTGDLSPAVDALARLPQMSYSNGRLELQRSQSFEVGYRKTQGRRTYAVSAFSEGVSNGRVDVFGDVSGIQANDLLSDGVSSTYLYNIGAYRRNGFLSSFDQQVGQSLDLTASYGRMGGFTAGSDQDQAASFTASALDQRVHNLVNAGVKMRAHRAGTKVTANYGWMQDGAVIPRHYFTTQDAIVSPGLNVYFRQPLPSLFGMPGHLEITADLRNLLAQGYLPINTGNGHMLLVAQSPRALRGGVNFIF